MKNIFSKKLIFIIIFMLIFSNSIFSKTNKFNKQLNLNDAFKNIGFRNIGPAIMGGRLTDIEGVKDNPQTFYIASASGGLWKTENNAITWTPLFDKQELLSIGDFAISPSNPEVIYVGTGEDNPRNSSSFGNGVYKSTDGGKTWTHIGLSDTERISRILINPHNPDIVYVAAIGKIYGPSKQRGVFVTYNGGKTWEKVLYIDEYHGASDIEMDPVNPNVLYAGMWYFQRKLWKFTSGDKRGGLFKSIDGGKTWKKIDKGFPELKGKIAVKIAPSNNKIVYVLIESDKGVLYKSTDGGDSFKLIYKDFEIVNRGFYYTELRVDPKDDKIVYAISSRLWRSDDGGKSFKRIARRVHVDFHTMWIDPNNPKRLLIGNDGGLAVSYDRGESCEFVNNIVLAQFYHVSIDKRVPFYYVCGGLQDNGSWCGPSKTKYYFGIPNDFWYSIGGGDGFYVVSHSEKKGIYLSEYQAGGISKLNLKTGENISNSPYLKRNDGGPVSELKYRFNWNAPIVKSSHKEDRVYFAGNVVFKSEDFGNTWEKISDDLTTNDINKTKGGGGPIFIENTTAEYHCTITAFAESPLDENILWVGTDDGNLYYTKDMGKNWIKVINNVKGLGKYSYVSSIEPSNFSKSRAYVTFDRHMQNDFRPYIFKTDNFGKTWKRISNGIDRTSYIHVIKEDSVNESLLFAGSEKGLYVSLNKGKNWERLNMKNLPNVPVYDMKIYDDDLILATHGRGIWIFDNISPLREYLSSYKNNLYIYKIKKAMRFFNYSIREFMGEKYYIGKNPPYGAMIYYYLKDNNKNKKYEMEIFDSNNKLVRTLNLNPKIGVNLAVWDLRLKPAVPRKLGAKPTRGWFGGSMGPLALPGKYKVKIKSGKTESISEFDLIIEPGVKYSIDNLKSQLKFALDLREKISQTNLILRKLDNIEFQTNNLIKVLNNKEMSNKTEVLKRLTQFRKEVINIKKKFVRYTNNYWMEGNKLLENLMNTYYAAQNGYDKPSKQLIDIYKNDILPEFNRKKEIANKFFRNEFKRFKTFLTENNLNFIM